MCFHLQFHQPFEVHDKQHVHQACHAFTHWTLAILVFNHSEESRARHTVQDETISDTTTPRLFQPSDRPPAKTPASEHCHRQSERFDAVPATANHRLDLFINLLHLPEHLAPGPPQFPSCAARTARLYSAAGQRSSPRYPALYCTYKYIRHERKTRIPATRT